LSRSTSSIFQSRFHRFNCFSRAIASSDDPSGFNDHHLDFRVVVDVVPVGEAREVTATTLVRTHNRLGRVYLTSILPFHRLITKSMLGQVCEAPS
jgi:hypothetical protein